MLHIKSVDEELKQTVKNIWQEHWGSDIMVTRGRMYRASGYPGYAAIEDNKIVGLVVFRIDNDECELLSLDSFIENRGIGTKLLQKVIEITREIGCRRVWLITSNDNTNAMRFYQKRGFEFKAIYTGAITEARRIKPEIPLLGYDNIPIKHEIEMEMKLK